MNLEGLLTEKRVARIKEVVMKRQFNLAVLLENVHDMHNISAVLRTCDAVGIFEIYAIITDPRMDLKVYERFDNNTSSGSVKWVKVHIFTSVEKAILAIRKKYDTILGTHLSKTAKSLYELDLTASVVLAFGNEHAGLSEELLDHLDGNFIIPQMGMVQSLNISVACAVSVYEAMRQRIKVNAYESTWTDQQEELYQTYLYNSKPHVGETIATGKAPKVNKKYKT